ncbi:lipocalin-like domain [Chlorella sorokiniana]|jgi:lipocalin|uniref:Lipocalin-like domain n=1 Tax=Chlorella sorokiniana TaxID=3076 RepID=A0A2P6TTZ3_CHLSO|nr:lipocalin-like domain [Chlorella sorokiniana]|eukprot:PRW57540.1 lipocalin-like domain [Chlorella sorokiniana]
MAPNTVCCRAPGARQRLSLAQPGSAVAPQFGAPQRRLPAGSQQRWRRQGRLATAATAQPAGAGGQDPGQCNSDADTLTGQQSPHNSLQQEALRLATAAAAAAVVLLGGHHVDAQAAAEYSYNGKELFAPMAYSGRWYEVASLKKGFAGEGQADCHCTQGIYVPKTEEEGIVRLQVNTFCVHGGPGGRLSGIQGSVSCANPILLEVLPEFKSPQEVADGIEAKCSLTFDSLPFIPPEPYNVIRTDYTSYALVQGAKDRSFVQVYSRVPNPGPEFIAEKKAILAELGYPAAEIKDTPQDCPEMSPDAMMAVMNKGMAGRDLMPADTDPVVAMGGYDLGPAPVKGITFDTVRNPLETLKNVFKLINS